MQWLANNLANYAASLSNPAAAIPLLVLAGFLFLGSWHWKRRKEGKPGVENSHVLLAGLAAAWLSLTVTIGAAAYWIIQTRRSVAAVDEGPLRWVHSFSMEGGVGQKVFSLRFRGANTSKRPVEMATGDLISLIDGSKLPLEVVGSDQQGKQQVVPIDQIQLIPPGAPIELVAKFGPPDPASPGKILGLDEKVFLDRWRQFSFNVKDDSRSYHMEFNETAMMPFFQGQVGPRVSIKPLRDSNARP